jgi:hypothetical protein
MNFGQSHARNSGGKWWEVEKRFENEMAMEAGRVV